MAKTGVWLGGNVKFSPIKKLPFPYSALSATRSYQLPDSFACLSAMFGLDWLTEGFPSARFFLDVFLATAKHSVCNSYRGSDVL